jgi:hypothetical protein
LGKFSFKVLNADGTAVIGYSYFELSREKDRLIGQGHACFTDGEHDIEYDTLKLRAGQAPAVLTLDHKFYNPDGSLQRAISANFLTGQASCTRYQNGVARIDSARLNFSADSYGGSAVILPLQQYLAEGKKRSFKMQAFNCVPKPRLIAVQAIVHPLSHWNLYPRPTVEVDIRPDLGWMSTLVAPWLPRLRAWFDPLDNWSFVGGEFSRFFQGPRIMLVRQMPWEIENADHRKGIDGGQTKKDPCRADPNGS